MTFNHFFIGLFDISLSIHSLAGIVLSPGNGKINSVLKELVA